MRPSRRPFGAIHSVLASLAVWEFATILLFGTLRHTSPPMCVKLHARVSLLENPVSNGTKKVKGKEARISGVL